MPVGLVSFGEQANVKWGDVHSAVLSFQLDSKLDEYFAANPLVPFGGTCHHIRDTVNEFAANVVIPGKVVPVGKCLEHRLVPMAETSNVIHVEYCCHAVLPDAK